MSDDSKFFMFFLLLLLLCSSCKLDEKLDRVSRQLEEIQKQVNK